jgi:hypothetical protein
MFKTVRCDETGGGEISTLKLAGLVLGTRSTADI